MEKVNQIKRLQFLNALRGFAIFWTICGDIFEHSLVKVLQMVSFKKGFLNN